MSNGREKVSEKVVEKIKKLIALGLSDPDSPESQSAMNKAAELMEEHGVASMDLDSHGNVNAGSLLKEFVEVYSIQTDAWERILGTKIAKSFDCRMITITSNYGLPTRAFLGTKSDVLMSVHFYKFIRMQIMRRAEAHFKRVNEQKSYGFGCVSKVGQRLDDMYKKREEIMTAGTKDLMLVKGSDVMKFVAEEFPHLTKKNVNVNIGSRDAYERGVLDGESIKMNRQVSGETRTASGNIMIGA